MPQVVLLYAGILGIMSLILASIPGRMRGQLGIAAGDGGNSELNKAMRRHSNFVEQVPISLLLITLLELSGAATLSIHLLGTFLVLTRATHAITFTDKTVKGAGRLIGAGGTALVTLVSAISLITRFF